MKPLRNFIRTARYITSHPFNRDRKLTALRKWFAWQIKSRLSGANFTHRYVDNTMVYVQKGWTGVTGNIYCGLHEFEFMTFTLHFLREEDVFADVGANVGTYTLLAAGGAGARVYAFEPIPSTFGILQSNITLNNLSSHVQLFNIGLASKNGSLFFTNNLDTMNHVVDDSGEGALKVEVRTCDEMLDTCPVLMKVDVEGFEYEVLKGADTILSDSNQQALIVEWNVDQDETSPGAVEFLDFLAKYGYQPVNYDGYTRTITAADRQGLTGNVLFVKDLNFSRERVKGSKQYRIQGKLI